MSIENNSDIELNKRISALNDLNKTIDQYECLFSKLIKQKELDFEMLNENLSPEERATLNWNLGYSVYTNYYRNIIFKDISIFKTAKY